MTSPRTCKRHSWWTQKINRYRMHMEVEIQCALCGLNKVRRFHYGNNVEYSENLEVA